MSSWDKRASMGNAYKGENFYTITPLPMYIKRRSALLNLISDDIRDAESIMDIGCGDGWYMKYFSHILKKGSKISGLDASSEMVRTAKELNPDRDIYLSSKGIKSGEKYDLIYTFATLAHVTDDAMNDLYINVYNSLNKGGKFIIFEQVAPFSYSGEMFKRRTIKDYQQCAKSNDFLCAQTILLSFRFHRFFERHVAKKYLIFCSGDSDQEKRVVANSHKLYRALSSLFLMFDINYRKKEAVSGWGNVYCVFEKRKK